MRAIVLPRAGGKTSRMLTWMVSDNRRVLVVMSAREQDRLRRLLQLLPAEAARVVTIGQVLDGVLRGRGNDLVLGIDELDQVLDRVLQAHVEVVAFTGVV